MSGSTYGCVTIHRTYIILMFNVNYLQMQKVKKNSLRFRGKTFSL